MFTGLALITLIALVTVGRWPSPVGAQEGQADEVTLRGLEASTWVGPGGTWVIDLAVEGAPAGAAIEGSIYEEVSDREAFDQALFGAVDGDQLATIPSIGLDPVLVAPGGGTAARLSLTLDSDQPTVDGHRHLGRDLDEGVYPVEVEVTDEDDDVIGRVVVFLTRVADPASDEDPLLVAPVLAPGGPPSIDADGNPRPDPDTIAEVADTANGLNVTEDLPATLAPRPETLEALARVPAGRAALDALRTASTSRQVVDGPYVDVALNAWVARGMQAELTRQRERGNSILSDLLGRVDSSTWLARDGLTPEAASELWSVGVRTAILGPGTTAGDEDDPGPGTVPAGPPRFLETLTADAGLSRALDRSLLDGGPRDPALDDNGLAAELAVIAGLSDGPAGVVLLPPEGWPSDPTAVGRLGAVLQDPLSPVRPVTTDDLLDEVPGRGATTLVPGPLPDLGGYPQSMALARARLTSYTSLVGAQNGEVAALDQRLLLSGARSLAPPERQSYVDSVLRTVDERLGGVVAPTEQSITLTARDADIPLTLRNRLDVPVTVLIEMSSDSRVEFRGEGDRITRQLEPGDQEIRIPIHTRVPGDAPIDITVLTPDGAVALDQVRYTVRSTAISGIGVVLSAGAATFLLIWWARHWTRTRRSRGLAENEGADA